MDTERTLPSVLRLHHFFAGSSVLLSVLRLTVHKGTFALWLTEGRAIFADHPHEKNKWLTKVQ